MLARLSLIAALLLTCLPAHAQTSEDGAHLAASYSLVKQDSRTGVSVGRTGEPVIIVTTRHYLAFSQLEAGILVKDLDHGMNLTGLRLADWGHAAEHPSRPDDTLSHWFMLAGDIRAEGRYEVTLAYSQVEVWSDEERDEEGEIVWRLVPDVEDVTREVAVLAEGQQVDNWGQVKDGQGATYAGLEEPEGLGALFEHGSFSFVPEVGDDSEQVGVSYELGYNVDRHDLGWFDDLPGRYTLDLELEGRFTSDADDLALAGFARGDLSARAMFLPGKDRYYPVGVRAAIGYEGDEEFSDLLFTATGQLVVSVPYVEQPLLAWHRLLGVNRAFAPPFLSAAGIHSDSGESGVPEQSRWELEAGWIAPVARRWDLDLRWRYFDFLEGGLDNEELFEASLTYYLNDDDFSQGLKFSLEEGFRPAVGDVGSTLIFGYLIRPF